MAKSPFTIAGRRRDARGGRRHRRHQSARGPEGIGGGGTGLIRPRHRSALGGRLPPRRGARRTISPARKESPRTIQKRSGMARSQRGGNRPRGQAAERRSAHSIIVPLRLNSGTRSAETSERRPEPPSCRPDNAPRDAPVRVCNCGVHTRTVGAPFWGSWRQEPSPAARLESTGPLPGLAIGVS